MKEQSWNSPWISSRVKRLWCDILLVNISQETCRMSPSPYQHENRVTFISGIHKTNTKAREKSQVTDIPSQQDILIPGETGYNQVRIPCSQERQVTTLPHSKATAHLQQRHRSSSEMLLSCVRAAQITSPS